MTSSAAWVSPPLWRLSIRAMHESCCARPPATPGRSGSGRTEISLLPKPCSAKSTPMTANTVFRFGHEGRPCYIAGPNESQGEICKTIRQLRNRLGDGGFSCIVPGDESEFADDDSWNEIPAEGST